jgi:uncharacterized protein (TIGR02147 family)
MQTLPEPNEWVLSSFQQIKNQNPRYSLRGFAKDLHMNPSHLAQFLQGKEGISLKKAHDIVKKLNWPAKQAEQFLALVEIKYSRSPLQKDSAKDRWKEISQTPDYQILKKDSFAFISDWYHLAILELYELNNFNPAPQWIAEQLEIQTEQAEHALSRLKRLGLITYVSDNEWQPSQRCTSTLDDEESDAIQNFHKQISKEFQKRVSLQNLNQREAQSFIFSVSSRKIESLKEKIRIFCDELATEVNTQDEKDQIYVFSTQLFSLLKCK